MNKSEIIPGRRRKISQKFRKRDTPKNLRYNRRGNTTKKVNPFTKKNDNKIFNISLQNNLKTNTLRKMSSKCLLKSPQILGLTNNKEILNKSAKLEDSNDENSEDVSFYDKYNTNKNVINTEVIEKKKTIKKRKKQEHSELEEIRHIIKQDAQNLNNPSLYYQQLFLNHIQKRNNNNSNHIFPDKNNKTILPFKRKGGNNVNINLNIKRTSTDLKNKNNFNNFGLTTKKLYKRSSIVIPTRFQKI